MVFYCIIGGRVMKKWDLELEGISAANQQICRQFKQDLEERVGDLNAPYTARSPLQLSRGHVPATSA
jgi:hypothetical protein